MHGMDKATSKAKTAPRLTPSAMNAPDMPLPPATPAEIAGDVSWEGEADNAPQAELQRWHELMAQVGRELAEPLTNALERVTTLTTTGRIDRAGLRTLREEIDRTRQTGIWCQQLARLASGRIRQSTERVHLTHTIQSVLGYRAREMQAKGLELRQSLLPVEIHVDASMLFGLLNALLDWCLHAAQGVVNLRVETRDWPMHASLSCQFRHQPPDAPLAAAEQILSRVNTMHWHLLEQTARTLGLSFDRQVDATSVALHLNFPHTVAPVIEGADTLEADSAHGFSDSVNSKPLAGSHVLVIAARRDLRLQVREALKSMGLVLDFVGSVREAAEFCHEGLPHAIVFEGALRSRTWDQLVSSIRSEVPEFVFIELAEGGRTFDISTISATGMARVGSDGIANALPSALVYELSRVM